MRGIFLREIRENLKWGIVICLAVLLFAMHEIRTQTAMILYEVADKELVFLAPLAGLLLGVVQSLFETRPDNWSFAVHRPVSRAGIFTAKCAAGLLTLYTALLIPCAYAVWWASRPGHQATPFQARMLLPIAANVLNAGCYYFAAMVLVLRKARWYGTRIMPLLLALACSGVITILVPQFWQAVVLIVLVQMIGALAAWGRTAGMARSRVPLSRA